MLLPDAVESAKPATLFPLLKASEQEGRATSILLSVLKIVPPFAEHLLSFCGAPVGKRSKLQCFTEVVPKKQIETDTSIRRPKSRTAGKLRPDGLITCESSSKKWSAFVEAKVAGNYLDPDQVKAYLKLAALNGVDTVITISSELTIHPSQNPVVAPKDVPKGVSLFHFSWLSLVTHASVLNNKKGIADLEQRLVMKDLRRFIASEDSKLIGAMTMSSSWADLVKSFHEQVNVPSGSGLLEDVADDWLELERYLELSFCSFLGEEVRISRERKFAADSLAYRQKVLQGLIADKQLKLDLSVPNAAGPLHLTVDLYAKSLLISMRVDVQQDCRPKTSVTWFLNQLKPLNVPEDLVLKGYTPRFRTSSDAKYGEVLEDPSSLLADRSLNPRSIEVVYSLPDATKVITKPKQFAEFVRVQLEEFYKELGQHLVRYTPPAPKPVKRDDVETEDDELTTSTTNAPQTFSAVEESEKFESLPTQSNFKPARLWPFSRK